MGSATKHTACSESEAGRNLVGLETVGLRPAALEMHPHASSDVAAASSGRKRHGGSLGLERTNDRHACSKSAAVVGSRLSRHPWIFTLYTEL